MDRVPLMYCILCRLIHCSKRHHLLRDNVLTSLRSACHPCRTDRFSSSFMCQVAIRMFTWRTVFMATENDGLATGSLISSCTESIRNTDTKQIVVLAPNTENLLVEDLVSEFSCQSEQCSTTKEDRICKREPHDIANCQSKTSSCEIDHAAMTGIPSPEGEDNMPLSEATASKVHNEMQIVEDDNKVGSPKASDEQEMQTDDTGECHKSGSMSCDELGDDDDDFDDQSNESTTDDGDPMMGYDFNEDGQLRDKDGQPFQFNYYKEKSKNQQRYERLGDAITEKIYQLLETKCLLKKLTLPLGVNDDEPHSFIFLSDDALKTTDRLLLLIHGSGVVRAGQWARRLIINDDLDKGTQIPYIKRALNEGYQVIVLNTNRNHWPDGGPNAEPIPDNEEPESHASYVWNNVIVKQSKAQHIAVVAHSYGGVVTTHLLEQETEEFAKRVFAVAFTDSVHSLGFNHMACVSEFYKKYARNYVTSDLPVGEPLQRRFEFAENAERVSAGHSKHEWTSYCSMESVFDYLRDKYKERLSQVSSGDDS